MCDHNLIYVEISQSAEIVSYVQHDEYTTNTKITFFLFPLTQNFLIKKEQSIFLLPILCAIFVLSNESHAVHNRAQKFKYVSIRLFFQTLSPNAESTSDIRGAVEGYQVSADMA